MLPAQTLERNETKLVGYAVTAPLMQDMENGIIGTMREKLLSKRHRIDNQIEAGGLYLVQAYPDVEWTPESEVPFLSIVAVEVCSFASVPEGFVQHAIPLATMCWSRIRDPQGLILLAEHHFQENKAPRGL